MKKIILIYFLTLSANSFAVSFNDAIGILQKHESIESLRGQSKASKEQGAIKGSWGDPTLKISAKNFPQESLKNNETPMTGVEFAISQKVALSTKFGNVEQAFNSLAKAYNYQAEDRKELLTRGLWEILILKRQINNEKKILRENLAWLIKILKVTKKLYANGKKSQQAILDLEIRKSETESELSNKQYDFKNLTDKLNYLIGFENIDSKTIPWQKLNQISISVVDNKEMNLKEKLNSSKFYLTAAKLNYIPDMTISVGLTKRSDFDDVGDFISASISFPLPFSGKKYSKHGRAKYKKNVAKNNYENYKLIKKRNVSMVKNDLDKIVAQLNILKSKTVKFAGNSRTITAKSYALGGSTYVELLQSELKLQEILMLKIMLESKRDIQKITLKYILGESLNE